MFVKSGIIFYSLLTIIATLAGIRICGLAAKKLDEHDFGGIVWDEIAGYLITMWLVPFSWPALILGFVLFRLFDIIKPWPIKWIDQKVHGGLGIMLDDVLAAVFAGLILFFLISKNLPQKRKMRPLTSFRQGLPEPRSHGWLTSL